MAVLGINHITVTVQDLDRSLGFYRDILGLEAHVRWDRGAYLSAGNFWFCLSLGDPKPAEDYTHLAFDVASVNFFPLCDRIRASGACEWQVSSSEGESLYVCDPDGHRLEIHVGNLETRLQSLLNEPYAGLVWL